MLTLLPCHRTPPPDAGRIRNLENVPRLAPPGVDGQLHRIARAGDVIERHAADAVNGVERVGHALDQDGVCLSMHMARETECDIAEL